MLFVNIYIYILYYGLNERADFTAILLDQLKVLIFISSDLIPHRNIGPIYIYVYLFG